MKGTGTAGHRDAESEEGNFLALQRTMGLRAWHGRLAHGSHGRPAVHQAVSTGGTPVGPTGKMPVPLQAADGALSARTPGTALPGVLVLPVPILVMILVFGCWALSRRLHVQNL